MQETALHKKHIDLGAKMVEFAGFDMPVQYSGVTQEHLTVRENVGIFDVSHMGQFYIEGENAKDLLQFATTNDVDALENGKAQYTCFPNANGGIVDDLIVYKMKDQLYFLVVNASNIDKDWSHLNELNQKYNATLRNVSKEISLIALQGPKATETLQKLTSSELNKIPYYHFEVGEVAGVENIIISNTGYTGSGGFELYVDNKDAVKLWDSLLQAGKEFSILPCGLAARDTLRLEKGFALYGNDIDDTTSPLEAGLGWITKLNKDFLNKDFLVKQKENGITKKLVGIEMQDKGIARKGYKLVDNNGKEIGEITSGTISPLKKIGIAMAYVQKSHTKIGTELYVQIRQKNIPAQVVKMPFI